MLATVNNDKNKYIFDYDRRLAPVTDNDFVAVHWNFPVKKLEYKEMGNLRKYTHKVIKMINSMANPAGFSMH